MSEPSWLERIWEEREERIYPAMFGAMRGIFPIPASRFQRFEVTPDPRWLTIGAFECAPTEDRVSWLYVTSGLSNPWDGENNPAEPCGYGCEFLIETTLRAEWPIRLLHHLASIQLLTMSARIPGEPFGRGHRIALHGSIDEGSSALHHVVLAEPPFGSTLQQASGTAAWMLCVGISDEEKGFARENGNEELLARLRRAGAFPVTNPERPSLRL